MTDEMRAELRRVVERMVRLSAAGVGFLCQIEPSKPTLPEDTPPLTTVQQLAMSVLLGDESVLPQALADYLLDQGHEYATAIMRQSTDEGVKAGIETEKARCLHLCGLARSYFARGGAVSNMAANELRLAIEGNLKPTPKAFFRSSLLR